MSGLMCTEAAEEGVGACSGGTCRGCKSGAGGGVSCVDLHIPCCQLSLCHPCAPRSVHQSVEVKRADGGSASGAHSSHPGSFLPD